MNIKLDDKSVKHVAKMVHEYMKERDCYYCYTPDELEKILMRLDKKHQGKYDPLRKTDASNKGIEDYLIEITSYDSLEDCASEYGLSVQSLLDKAIDGAFDVYEFDGYVLVHENTL